MRIVTPQEALVMRQFLQGDARSSLMFAPKVTLFSGQSAMVKDTKQRPFVTGFRNTKNGGIEPQVSQITDGTQFGMRATLVDDEKHIQLNLQVRHSELFAVEVIKTQIAGQDEGALVQVPHIRESNLKTAVTLASGDSVLVSPLRRDKQGKLQICLITPRLIEEY